VITGGDGSNVIVSGAGADAISGGAGNDTITAGAGRDIIDGGAGADRFNFAHGDTTANNGLWDVINNWNAADKLHFAGAAVTAATYTELTAADALTAFNQATADIAAGAHNVVVVQVGGDVLVFADSGDNNTIGDAVVLVGKSLADIDATSLV
jgi:Ca2+-binding RTX toxin-like protein